MKNRNRIAITLVVAVVAIIFLIMRSKQIIEVTPVVKSTTTTSLVNVNGKSYNIETEFIDRATSTLPKPPSLVRTVTVPISISRIAAYELRERIASVTADLTKNPYTYEGWLNLGLLRKSVEDYEGAIQAWAFATELRPTTSTAYLNQAQIYHLYLRNYPEAEKQLLKAIEVEPVDSSAYIDLYELYTQSYVMKKAQALSVLQQGVRVNPDNMYLLASIGAHYKNAGDRTAAKNYYTRALVIAKRSNDLVSQASIGTELKSL